MNLFYTLLLLLLLLSGFSESLQHVKPPDLLHTTRVTVCPNIGSAQLGGLAPVLPQNEVYRIVLSQNEVVPTSSEVLNFDLTLSGVFKFVPLLNEVFEIVAPKCQLFNSVKTLII
jgi:hypothetical protein